MIINVFLGQSTLIAASGQTRATVGLQQITNSRAESEDMHKKYE
jgi:hypothetical protein